MVVVTYNYYLVIGSQLWRINKMTYIKETNIIHHYPRVVINAIKEYYKCNYNEELTDYDVEIMHNYYVLATYLEWEGIIGYTNTIIDIFDCMVEEDK